jgi:GTPase involved in cell partitioning and DNA repair
MMVALSNAVIKGYMGKEFDIKDNRLSILTKCAIDSDATVGFNLPLIDPSKPDDGNIFVGVMNQFVKGEVISDEFDKVAEATSKEEKVLIVKAIGDYDKEKDTNDKSLNAKIDKWGKKQMSNFKQNMTELFDEILKKAKEIKDEAKSKKEKDAAKQQTQSDNAENTQQ